MGFARLLRKALSGCLYAPVGIPALLDFLHVVGSLSTAHIAIHNNGVVVINGLSKLEHIF